MNTYTFTKANGDWFIAYTEDLIGFDKSDFTILEESNRLLDFLSNGKKKVTLSIDTTFFEKALALELTRQGEAPQGGGYYQIRNTRGRVLQEELWLCDVPLFVFGDIPEHIYLRREKRLTIQPTS